MEEKYQLNLEKEITDIINSNLLRCIISNPRHKDGISKIKIRPIMLNGTLMYQATEQSGTKVFHSNYDKSETIRYILRMLLNSFKQCELINNDYTLNILVSKKGKITINKRKSAAAKIIPGALKNNLEHNRSKNYIIQEGTTVPFMVELGVMTKEGKIVNRRYDKFRQINRFLEFIRDIREELPKDREISIIDFGCGKSYLTFAIYYYLHELCGLDVKITGLDLKADVIENCNRLSNEYGYDKLVFKMGDIAEYEQENGVDMVVTLHACDTATDFALEKAVRWGAKVILSVPCCQHELNRQIDNELMAPILSYGILKDRFAAIMTDAIRAETLKIRGYDAEILEFIDMEHTPKNLLIRAVRRKSGIQTQQREEALRELVREFGAQPTIVKLLLKD